MLFLDNLIQKIRGGTLSNSFYEVILIVTPGPKTILKRKQKQKKLQTNLSHKYKDFIP